MTLREKLENRIRQLTSYNGGYSPVVLMDKNNNCLPVQRLTLARVVNLLEHGWTAIPF